MEKSFHLVEIFLLSFFLCYILTSLWVRIAFSNLLRKWSLKRTLYEKGEKIKQISLWVVCGPCRHCVVYQPTWWRLKITGTFYIPPTQFKGRPLCNKAITYTGECRLAKKKRPHRLHIFISPGLLLPSCPNIDFSWKIKWESGGRVNNGECASVKDCNCQGVESLKGKSQQRNWSVILFAFSTKKKESKEWYISHTCKTLSLCRPAGTQFTVPALTLLLYWHAFSCFLKKIWRLWK